MSLTWSIRIGFAGTRAISRRRYSVVFLFWCSYRTGFETASSGTGHSVEDAERIEGPIGPQPKMSIWRTHKRSLKKNRPQRNRTRPKSRAFYRTERFLHLSKRFWPNCSKRWCLIPQTQRTFWTPPISLGWIIRNSSFADTGANSRRPTTWLSSKCSYQRAFEAAPSGTGHQGKRCQEDSGADSGCGTT